jgi:hypothetical protein
LNNIVMVFGADATVAPLDGSDRTRRACALAGGAPRSRPTPYTAPIVASMLSRIRTARW